MMFSALFRAVARFEFRYQLTSPVFLVVAVLFFLLAFGNMVSDNVQLAAVGTARHRLDRYAYLSPGVTALRRACTHCSLARRVGVPTRTVARGFVTSSPDGSP